MTTEAMYPYVTLRGRVEDAVESLDAAVQETHASFRDDQGNDHSPPDFDAAIREAADVAGRLRAVLAAIKASADAEQVRYDADDDFWSRDK